MLDTSLAMQNEKTNESEKEIISIILNVGDKIIVNGIMMLLNGKGTLIPVGICTPPM